LTQVLLNLSIVHAHFRLCAQKCHFVNCTVSITKLQSNDWDWDLPLRGNWKSAELFSLHPESKRTECILRPLLINLTLLLIIINYWNITVNTV